MHVDDLFDENIQPEQNKQLVPKLPTYEESLADKLYLPPEPEDLPPECDEDEIPDYALGEEDRTAEIFKDLEITDYVNADKILSQPEMTPQKTSYLNKVIVNAHFWTNQLKSYVTSYKGV